MKSLRLSAAALFVVLAAAPPSRAVDTFVWDGQGVVERWASGINWVCNNAPTAGSRLVFNPNGALGYETDNNFPHWTNFYGIENTSQAAGPDDGWVHDGNPIVLGAGGLTLATAIGSPFSHVEFKMPLRLGASQTWSVDDGTYALFSDEASLDLNSRTLRFEERSSVGESPPLVEFIRPITGGGSIIVGSSFGVRLRAVNSFTSPLIIENGGFVDILDGATLGSTSAPTTVRGQLVVGDESDTTYPVAENLILESGGIQVGADSATFSGSIAASGDSVLSVSFGSEVVLTGALSGTGSLLVNSISSSNASQSTVRFEGTAPGSDAGELRIAGDIFDSEAECEVRLNKTSAAATLGPVTVLDGGRLVWQRASQLGTNCSLTLEAGSLADMNGHSDTVQDLYLRGLLLMGGATLSVAGNITADPVGEGLLVGGDLYLIGNLRLVGNTVPHTLEVAEGFVPDKLHVQGDITESSPVGTSTLRKTGGGFLDWTGNSGIDRLEITDGRVVFEGQGAGMDAVLDGGKLDAEGTLRDVTAGAAGGTLYPRVSGAPGGLTLRNLALNAASTFSATDGQDLAQPMVATGSVSLGGAELYFSHGSTGGIGGQIVLIDKQSIPPVTGTFAGLPEGTLLSQSPVPARSGWAPLSPASPMAAPTEHSGWMCWRERWRWGNRPAWPRRMMSP